VVCQSIKDTERVGQLLCGSEYIGDPGAILEITSESSDEALEALAAVESPDSPIRAIVSVNMLREGWDVRNIAVIVALRKLASQTLTEQILGRGLRLPFGRRTGVSQVDQVDIVAHDSYEQLLRQKNSLAARIEIDGDSKPAPSPPTSAAVPLPDLAFPRVPVEFTLGGDAPPLPGVDELTGGLFGESPRPVPAGFAEMETREGDRGPRFVRRTEGSPLIVFPRREARLEVKPFDLSSIANADAEAAGRQFTQETPSYLYRTALTGVRKGTKVKVRETTTTEQISAVLVGVESVAEALRNAILHLPEVPQTLPSRNGAYRLAKAFLKGAGVTSASDAQPWGQDRIGQAVQAMRSLVRDELRKDRHVQAFVFVDVGVPTEPIIMPSHALDATVDDYAKQVPFGGWKKSITPTATFDARTTEWALARILDDDPHVAWWLRLDTMGQVHIQMPTAGHYYPDFIVIDTNGRHWVVEGKSDKEAKADDVQAKKTSAETWARAVRDQGKGDWHYLFATESAIRAAHHTWDGLVKAARPE
jgi:type III restriction enzyme